MRSMTIAYITNKMEENMKKFIITAIIAVVLIIPVFADSALSGHVQSQVVYDFSEPENQTLKYNIKGSLASFTVDFTNLSFNKKGEKKPYVDISASAALQFNVGDHDIEWATYAFAIGQTDVVGVIKLNKFNLVADVAGKELVVDFLHNNVGGDWAKSPYTKFKYTTADLVINDSPELNPDTWNVSNIQETAFSYNNMIHEFARLRPGFTITYGGWSTGASFDLTFGGENEFGSFTLGTETPDYQFGDAVSFKSALAIKFDLNNNPTQKTRQSLIGGSVKGGYKSGDFLFNIASDYGFRIDTVENETEAELDGFDVSGTLQYSVANLGVYFTTRTPILGYKIERFGFSFTNPEVESLIEISNVLSAKLVLDFHNLSSPVPVTIYATALDVLYKQDDLDRDLPYENAEQGQGSTQFYPYVNFRALSRYGRDLDVEVSTDAFVNQHISQIWAFGRRLLQTKELGAGIEFTFDDLRFGDVVSWTIDTKMLWDKVFIEYDPEQFRAYAAAQFYKSFSDEDPMEFTAIAGISSDKIVEIATVGAEFRYKMSDYETESVFADSCKDFTIYCKVEF